MKHLIIDTIKIVFLPSEFKKKIPAPTTPPTINISNKKMSNKQQ